MKHEALKNEVERSRAQHQALISDKEKLKTQLDELSYEYNRIVEQFNSAFGEK